MPRPVAKYRLSVHGNNSDDRTNQFMACCGPNAWTLTGSMLSPFASPVHDYVIMHNEKSSAHTREKNSGSLMCVVIPYVVDASLHLPVHVGASAGVRQEEGQRSSLLFYFSTSSSSCRVDRDKKAICNYQS